MSKENVFQKLGCKKVINACGYMSKLGTSIIRSNVAESISEAGQNFVVVEQLNVQVNEKIQKMLNVPACQIVNSAASAISLCSAALVYQNHYQNIYNTCEKNEIIIPKGHNITFGAPMEIMLKIGGAKVIEAGWANECQESDVVSKITERTVGLMYVVSHHCVQKNIIDLVNYQKIAQKYSLPVIVDCAAEMDLVKYCNLNLDLLIFSGAKSLNGPTSGIIFGEKNLIKNVQSHLKGIGRAMKIGKESIVGLAVAIEDYLINSKPTFIVGRKDLEKLVNKFNMDKYFKATLIKDDTREIYRCRIFLIKNDVLLLKKINLLLQNGEIAIFLRDYNLIEGYLDIDGRTLTSPEELNIIYTQLNKIMEELKNERD